MSDKDDVLANWRAQLEAMDQADTAALERLFAPDAVLVHMTGHRQDLSDWLAGMRAQRFVYHQVVDKGIRSIEVDGDRARLVGRVITGVTDDGSGQAWRLEIGQDFVRIGGRWVCTESRVTMW